MIKREDMEKSNIKRILITGGGGFIGQNLLNSFNHINAKGKRYEVYSPSREICDVTERNAFSKYLNSGIDHVVHLAAMTSVADAWNNPGEAIKQNVDGTINVADFCRMSNSKMTLISAYVYGVQYVQPINESAELHSNNPYSLSKILSEEICEFYNKNYDVDVTILRPFNIYGPGLKKNFLLPTIVEQLLDDSDSVTVNSLTTKRDYTYVDDLVDAILMSIERTNGFEIFNIGYGASCSTNELIMMLKGILGIDKRIESREIYRKNEIQDCIADITRISEKWGWEPRISLDEGLRLYLDDYIKNRR